MFGYIKPCREELRVGEYELYRSLYCGLCRAMGLHICKSSRLTLSYDIVFLSLLRIAVSGETPKVTHRRCAAHPLKKRNVAECPDALRYCARVSAILSYYKLADDRNDTRGIRRVPTLLISPSAKKYRRRAGMTELDASVAARLRAISELEAGATSSPEALADEFGHMLGAVFAFGENEKSSKLLREIGFHTGRWIYFIDACDDYAKDKKSGEYNPFSSEEKLPAEYIENTLNLELAGIARAFDLIDTDSRAIKNIIENIIYLGMPREAARILKESNE